MAQLENLEGDQTQEEGSSNTEEGTEGQDTGSTTSQETEGASGGQGSESQLTFRNPMLQGKSPEEIERMFQALNETVQSQNTELNAYQSRMHPENQERASGPDENLPEYGDNFVTPELRTLENRLAKKLEQMVAPLQQGFQTQQAQSARAQIRAKLKHFTVLEPTIDQLLRQQGLNPALVPQSQLEQVYYTAVGLANERGINLSQPATEGEATGTNSPGNANPNGGNAVNIPQRRPSTSPLPQGQQKQKVVLTEEQRGMARFYGMTDEQYYKELNTPDDEVVTPGFSKENW